MDAVLFHTASGDAWVSPTAVGAVMGCGPNAVLLIHGAPLGVLESVEEALQLLKWKTK